MHPVAHSKDSDTSKNQREVNRLRSLSKSKDIDKCRVKDNLLEQSKVQKAEVPKLFNGGSPTRWGGI